MGSEEYDHCLPAREPGDLQDEFRDFEGGAGCRGALAGEGHRAYGQKESLYIS